MKAENKMILSDIVRAQKLVAIHDQAIRRKSDEFRLILFSEALEEANAPGTI